MVVYFYPAAGTPGCTKQACDFRDNLAELDDAGFDVLGISPDPPAKLAKFRDAEGLTSRCCPTPTRRCSPRGAPSARSSSTARPSPGVIRSTFVVDADGKIEEALYNVRATGHVAKLRKDLKV